ncbi:hypothetical protein ACFYXD_33930 [Streptomyces platensis]|uniref:hypothetical protein n=1 Tax=Streptomyces platensis TaxID=58346 RepID=UPI003689D793
MYRRLMGSVDPDLVITAEPALRDVDGARDVGQVRMRMDRPHCAPKPTSLLPAAHRGPGLRTRGRRRTCLIHAVSRLTAVTVHPDLTDGYGKPDVVLARHTEA